MGFADILQIYCQYLWQRWKKAGGIKMKRELILNGFRIGEYTLSNEEFYQVFEQKYRDGMNYVGISSNICDERDELGSPFPQETFIE